MTAAEIISVLALVVATFALVANLRQRKVTHRLSFQLETLVTKLHQPLHETKPVTPAASRFSAHLNDAEKSQQKSQEEYQKTSAGKPQGQADKYRYAVALAAQGQNVDSIAQALNMAPAEVEQVMQLARVKRPA